MSWTAGQVTGHKNLLLKVKDFATRTLEAGTVTPNASNVGDGTVYGASASDTASAELITLTCTTTGGAGVGQFSVAGATTGAMGTATVGVPFTSTGGEVSFTILAGATDFTTALPDSFTFTPSSITSKWTVDRWNTDWDGNGNYELIMHSDGITGTDEIYFGIQANVEGTTEFFNCKGLTGYIATSSVHLDDQMGAHIHPRLVPLTAGLMNYYIWDFEDGIKFVAQTGGYSIHGYFGWASRLASPSQWAYPMVCGGSSRDTKEWSTAVADDYTSYWTQGRMGEGLKNYADMTLTVFDGANWQPVRNTFLTGQMRVHPIDLVDTENIIYDVNGDIPLFEASILSMQYNMIYGGFHGVYIPVTAGGVVASGDTILKSDAAYLVFQDINRGGVLCAMDMQ